MARKRGGLAGIWDRNKKIIKPIATIGAGLLGGPAAAAAVNGAISGLDREGQGGIGFDVGKGAMGAATGYAMGTGAGALKNGIMSRLGASAMPMQGSGAWMTAAKAASGGNGVVPGMAQAAQSGLGAMLKDPKTLATLGQTAVGGLNAYQNAEQMRMQREQQQRNNSVEDEQRARQAAMDPVRSRLLQMMLARLGMQGVA